jgi:hypothetical protein
MYTPLLSAERLSRSDVIISYRSALSRIWLSNCDILFSETFIYIYMYIYVYIILYIYVCICIRIYTYICICICICIYIYAYIYSSDVIISYRSVLSRIWLSNCDILFSETFIYIHIYIYVYIMLYIYVCICIHIYTYICICICIYTYVYIYIALTSSYHIVRCYQGSGFLIVIYCFLRPLYKKNVFTYIYIYVYVYVYVYIHI